MAMPSSRERDAGPNVADHQWDLSEFKPVKKLYKGYASKVYLALDQSRGAKTEGPEARCVLKVYDILKLSKLTRYQLEREVRIHQSLDHPHIVQLNSAFMQSDFFVLVLEYVGNGDLYNFLHQSRVKLTERRLVRMVIKPCLLALKYLHERHIIHRDIKPENILIDENQTIKLADFGLSIRLSEEVAVTRAGTVDYMAPEVVACPLKRLPSDYKHRTDITYDAKVDTWSVGVLAYELLTGVVPFKSRQGDDILRLIQTTPLKMPDSLSRNAQDFVATCLQLDAAQRPSVADLLDHAWLREHADEPRPHPAALVPPAHAHRHSNPQQKPSTRVHAPPPTAPAAAPRTSLLAAQTVEATNGLAGLHVGCLEDPVEVAAIAAAPAPDASVGTSATPKPNAETLAAGGQAGISRLPRRITNFSFRKGAGSSSSRQESTGSARSSILQQLRSMSLKPRASNGPQRGSTHCEHLDGNSSQG